MSITQILINVFFILSVIFVACFPKKKRIWWIFFICNICVQIYFRTDSFLKNNTIHKLDKKVENLSVSAPKLNLEGKIVLDSGLTGHSVASETIESIRTLFNQNKYDDAYNIAKSLVEKMPNFGMGFFLLGSIEAAKGNDDLNAESHLNKAIKLGLTKYIEAWARNSLAVIAEKQGKISTAISLLEQSIELDPTIKEIKEYLDKLRLIQSQK